MHAPRHLLDALAAKVAGRDNPAGEEMMKLTSAAAGA